MTQLSPANLDRAFALLVEAALKGERCPVTSGPDAHPWLRSQQVLRLASDKRIRIEVGLGNWRQVTILTGEHAGKKTAPNPRGGAAYKCIGKPSAPRPLTAAELNR